MEYRVLGYANLTALVETVNIEIKRGWKPIGGIHTVPERGGYSSYLQAMVREPSVVGGDPAEPHPACDDRLSRSPRTSLSLTALSGLQFSTHQHASEYSWYWRLTNGDGDVLLCGGPYSNQALAREMARYCHLALSHADCTEIG